MTGSQEFFNIDTTRRQLGELNRVLERLPKDGSNDNLKVEQLIPVIGILMNNTGQFDENCQQNIKWIGSGLTFQLHNLDDLMKDFNLDSLITMIYRFVIEFDLSIKNELSRELLLFQRFVKDNINKFNEREQEAILYARQEMPVAILKQLLNHDEIGNLKNVSAYSDQLDKKFQNWESSLVAHELTIKSFQQSLDSHETAFNFVGLYDGFNDLAIAKKKELKALRCFMVLFGFLLILPLLVELYFVYTHQAEIGKVHLYFLGSTALISLSLTLLFIYFFKISVRSVDSCKAQLLQVELRKTLCRFIQSYATYSKDIKEKNPESLAKFESLIFSGIVSNEDKLPSAFDGIEQMGNFVKAMRGT